MCDEDKTSNSVQACSDLAHVVLVLVGVRRVRRVTVVHIGLEGVLVVVHFCVAIFFVNCCIGNLHHPSVTVNCVDCYRYNRDKFCIQLLLRFMPQMNR